MRKSASLNLPVVVWKVWGADDCRGALAQSTRPSANSWRFYINITFNLNQQHVGRETDKAWLLDVMTIYIGCLRQEHYMLLNFPIFTVAWKPLLGDGAPVWNLKSKTNTYNFTY